MSIPLGNARLGDLAIPTPVHTYPPHAIIEGSKDVFINNLPAARMGDMLAPHGCSTPPESIKIAKGSLTVFINGMPAARITDPTTCGTIIGEGSMDVFSG
jgi:uncharacterized Zn-binding protein involved in type VI secretion